MTLKLPTEAELSRMTPEQLKSLWLLVRTYQRKLAEAEGCGLMPTSAVQDLAKAVPTDLVQAIVQDNRRGVSEPGWLPPETSRSGVERGSGWLKPTPLEPPSGTRYVDQIAESFAARDRVEEITGIMDKVRKLKGVRDE